jgi:hypothetical protein
MKRAGLALQYVSSQLSEEDVSFELKRQVGAVKLTSVLFALFLEPVILHHLRDLLGHGLNVSDN